jgi:putative ABC transport system ATP-binding protein
VEVEKTYRLPTGEVRALQGVSWEFPRGSLTVVAGPSGSGKSSLLRLMAGLDRPTKGSVVVDGMRLEVAKPRALRALRRGTVGYVFQRPSDNFYPQLTLGDHLRVAQAGAGRRPTQISAKRLLAHLGLTDRINHVPSELSGGEQQRGAFAQVLIAGATIILADEPTAELDTDSAKSLLDATDSLIAEGVTLIVATHDRDVISRARSTLRLDHGLAVTGTAGWHASTSRESAPLNFATLPFAAGLRRSSEAGEAPEVVPVLELDHLTKSYRRGEEAVRAVRDVSAQVRESELVGIIGRSGSGKTTLLNVVSGWERPDAGRVRLAGHDLVGAVPEWDDVSVIPQKLGLIDEFTIRENIEYPAKLTNTLEHAAPVIEALLDGLGLAHLQHRYPSETSIGEQQRAAVARALVLVPRLVLADEPTGHQDRAWARAVLDALRQVAASGTACLAATHSVEFARYLDRVWTMSDGRVSERNS